MRLKIARTAGLAAAIAGVTAAAALAGITFFGADGVGDPYYPKMGNTGYDVQSYDVDLRYQNSGKVRSTTTIDAVADTDDGAPPPGLPLAGFDLDFRGPEVTGLTVNGADADFSRNGQELVIEAPSVIADGAPFETVVSYKGKPRQVKNPDGSKDGWTRTRDGAVALGEPQQTPSWIPVNDHPTDKATWHFRFDIPRDLEAISNGELLQSAVEGRRRVTEWAQADPMTSYLALAAIGKFRVDENEINGIPYIGAVDRKLGKPALEALRGHTQTAHDFLEEVAGPYPFASTGGIVDPSKLGFAMETQTRSYYPNPPPRQLVIHEVAHQWFGDSVSVDRWKEIWLNEGFATYMEWLYQEETGGETVADRFARIYNANGPGASIWDPPPADPGGPANLFSGSVYDRGAMALQVLRADIGDEDFFEVLETWAQDNAGGNVSTEDLYALIEEVTGEEEPDAFDDWLYEDGKPSCPTCRDGSSSQARQSSSNHSTYRRGPSA
jgi:aminopeptidase N